MNESRCLYDTNKQIMNETGVCIEQINKSWMRPDVYMVQISKSWMRTVVFMVQINKSWMRPGVLYGTNK